ncbi:putative Radical SAM core domain-containing protein [Vibrio crassostreae]|nr:putative Radical SAM core domain-containing protein [Vibrio crassostreae]CAK3798140.1 putative Radical SAM core domain-containing protein [Vibrio crassostreae]
MYENEKLRLVGDIYHAHHNVSQATSPATIDAYNYRYVLRKEPFGAAVYDREKSKYYFINTEVTKSILEQETMINSVKKEFDDCGLDSSFSVDDFIIIDRCPSKLDTALSAPLRVYIDTTYECNLSCDYCYNKLDEKDAETMSLEDYANLFSQMQDAGVYKLSIAGGEPFADKRIFEIVSMARERGITVSMTSNGTMLNAKIIEGLTKSGIKRLTISLDSATPSIAERLRPGLKFDRLIRNIKLLGGIGVDISLKCTFNVDMPRDEVVRLVELADSIDCISSIKFNFERDLVAPFYHAELDEVKRYFELFHFIESLKKDSSVKIILNQMNPAMSPTKVMSSRVGIGCPAGRDLMYINPYGEVKGCALLSKDFVAGNIKNSSLLDLWLNSEQMKKLKNYPLGDKCINCKYIESCRGGCTQRRVLNGGMSVHDYYCFKDVESFFNIDEPRYICSNTVESYELSHL